MTKVINTALRVIAILGAAVLTSCEDTPNVGASLVQDESEVVIATEFAVTGKSVDNPRVQSRTVTQVLGQIDAKGYGRFASDFMTQFMPSAKIDTQKLTAKTSTLSSSSCSCRKDLSWATP